MKVLKTTFSLLLISLLSTGALAQQPVKEKHILGNWKMIIDIDEELDEAEREDTPIGRITLKWVSGLVSGLLDEINIYMEFRPKGELKVIVEAFGEREIEYSSWYIDDDGRLFIEDTDSFSSDDDDYWMFDDDLLISYENDGWKSKRNNVYMVNIDDK